MFVIAANGSLELIIDFKVNNDFIRCKITNQSLELVVDINKIYSFFKNADGSEWEHTGNH